MLGLPALNAIPTQLTWTISFLFLFFNSLPTQHLSSLFRKFWIKLTFSFTEISRLFSCATFPKLFLALRWIENLLAYLYAGSTMIVIRYKLLHYNKNKRIVNSNNKSWLNFGTGLKYAEVHLRRSIFLPCATEESLKWLVSDC